MTTYYQTESNETTHTHQSAHLIESACRSALLKFKSILTSYALFHLSFALLEIIQIGLLFSLLFLNISSTVFAVAFASLLLTLSSHLIIAYYFQWKKPFQFKEIEKQFYQACAKTLPIDASDDEIHLSLGHSMFQLATYVGQRQIYSLSFGSFSFLEDLFLIIGYHLHFKDLISMQELLMRRSIEEHIELIKKKPIDLAVHTSLANAFTVLAKLYKKPTNLSFETTRFIESKFSKESIREKFLQATNRAIEELKILDDLAPNDPWVHAQLASCYHHLDLSEDEIREYEILLNIRPKDKEILYRLGMLYFKLGKNAKGLSIYGSLKEIDAKDASHLISHYNGFSL